MRQGRASPDNNDGRKVEPRVREINPAAVGQIGSVLGNHITGGKRILPHVTISEPMYTGKEGFQSPRDRTVQVFKGGSQGRTD